ncbi:MAG: flagellar hook-associated protein FlgK [Bryobacteraceae bacterium]
MSSLFSVLSISSNALGAFTQAMNVTGENTANASTPGYAKQVAQLVAQPFDTQLAVGGGVRYGGTVDTRDQYAEQNVRQCVSAQGQATQELQQYTSLQDVFPVDGQTGISVALSGFFNAFSALTTAPNDADLRQTALDSAQQVVQAFNQSITQLNEVSDGVEQTLTEQVGQVNQLAQQIASINQQIEQNASAAIDPGLSAQMSSTLQQLAQYADVSAVKQDNGTTNVNIGQSSIVSGDQAQALQLVPGNGQMSVEDSQGNNVAAGLQSGSLQAVLNMTSTVLPSTLANLNQMAQSFATAVNGALEGGVDQSGVPQANLSAQDLFSFNAAAGAAATMSVNPLTTSQLALADPASPGGDAVAVQIANLQQATNLIPGQTQTLSDYYGSLASQVGQLVSNAQNDQTTTESLTAQAQSSCQNVEGVSLDEEAMNLLEYQRGYEAMSKVVETIDEITYELINDMVQ